MKITRISKDNGRGEVISVESAVDGISRYYNVDPLRLMSESSTINTPFYIYEIEA